MNWLISVVVVIALGGCADSGSNTAAPPSDSGPPLTPAHERLDCDLPAVMEYCGGSACHYDNSAPDLASGLTLWDRAEGKIPDDIHTRLVDVPADYRNVVDPSLCPSPPELLVDPSNVEESLILKKLMATQTCGAEMPKFPYPEWGTVANPGPQRESLVQCVRAWVALLVEDFRQSQ